MIFLKKVTNFFGEVKAELEKVAWSNRQELKAATAVVIVMTALMAVYIGVVDVGLSRVLAWFLQR